MVGRSSNPADQAGIVGLRPGDLVADKYRVDAVLGVGGMGVVYLAQHVQLEGPLALKFLSSEYAANPEAIRRFHREAQAAARLRSEHVVRVFDVGTHSNGLPYIVMEYLDGGDLAQMLTQLGPLPVERAASVVIQTCDALSEAHAKGIVHRDLKPANLFCVPRREGGVGIKVVDFGISKVIEAEGSLEPRITTTSHAMGSPSYMSPEQMKTPGLVDHRSDIWSMGVVLYEILTGHLPFIGATYAEICLAVHQDAPAPLAHYRPDVAPRLLAVVMRCLEKDRERRYGSAEDLAQALSEFLPTPSRPPRESGPATAVGPTRGPTGTVSLTPVNVGPHKFPGADAYPGGNPSSTPPAPAGQVATSLVSTGPSISTGPSKAPGRGVRTRWYLLSSILAVLSMGALAAAFWGRGTSPEPQSAVLAQTLVPNPGGKPQVSGNPGGPMASPESVDPSAIGTSANPVVGSSAAPSPPAVSSVSQAPTELPAKRELPRVSPGSAKAAAPLAGTAGVAAAPARSVGVGGANVTPPRVVKPRTERDPKSTTWTR